jgi:predicted metal-dependent phosphoesterase TrpH
VDIWIRLQVEYEVGFTIDLHVHTKYSGDTDSDAEECVLRAIEVGLSGIAFTEHYSYDASWYVDALREKYGSSIRIFRGVEFSCLEGHCLVFGTNTDKLSLRHQRVMEVVRVVTLNGGIVIPSHPFRGSNSLGERIWTLQGICAVEGHNGCNHRAFNEMAVSAAKTLGLPCTGGSDAHQPDEVGLCYTDFHDEVTYENFVELLKAGQYNGVDVRKVSRGWTVGQTAD